MSCNWCEVTYINHVVPRHPAHDVSNLIADFQPPSLPETEDLAVVSRYRIDDEQGVPRGRMSVSLTSATRIEDAEPIWVLTLTTRLLPREATWGRGRRAKNSHRNEGTRSLTTNAVGTCRQGWRGTELGKPPLATLKLAAQDQRAGTTLLKQLPQICLGHELRLPIKDGAQPLLQGGVERLRHVAICSRKNRRGRRASPGPVSLFPSVATGAA
jgi:hypothetical protein